MPADDLDGYICTWRPVLWHDPDGTSRDGFLAITRTSMTAYLNRERPTDVPVLLAGRSRSSGHAGVRAWWGTGSLRSSSTGPS
jgi:hypothetical protein